MKITAMPESFLNAYCQANADYYTANPEQNYRVDAEQCWDDCSNEERAQYV
jgi:hypothetical protein